MSQPAAGIAIAEGVRYQRAADNETGTATALDNLARFVESAVGEG